MWYNCIPTSIAHHRTNHTTCVMYTCLQYICCCCSYNIDNKNNNNNEYTNISKYNNNSDTLMSDYSSLSHNTTTKRLIDILPNQECPICLTTFTNTTNIYQTNCNHLYCADCITRQLQTIDNVNSNNISNQLCPICRTKLKTIKLVQYTPDAVHNYQIIRIKFDRQLYDIFVDTNVKIKHFKNQLQSQFRVDMRFSKLIHAGKLITTTDELRAILQRYDNITIQLIASIRDYSMDNIGSHNEHRKSHCVIC